MPRRSSAFPKVRKAPQVPRKSWESERLLWFPNFYKLKHKLKNANPESHKGCTHVLPHYFQIKISPSSSSSPLQRKSWLEKRNSISSSSHRAFTFLFCLCSWRKEAAENVRVRRMRNSERTRRKSIWEFWRAVAVNKMKDLRPRDSSPFLERNIPSISVLSWRSMQDYRSRSWISYIKELRRDRLRLRRQTFSFPFLLIHHFQIRNVINMSKDKLNSHSRISFRMSLSSQCPFHKLWLLSQNS